MPDVQCGACHQSVPDGRYCVRCGAPLGGAGHSGPSRARTAFAAAPHQHLHVPHPLSTLFPHLPRSSATGFHAVLAVGLGVVILLAATGLIAAGLVAAAVLVPVLTIVYLHEVNVYDGEPPRVLAFTALWGAACGVAVGTLTRVVAEPGAEAFTTSRAHLVLVQGVLLPLLGTLLAFVGPVLLLRRPRFHAVLDGATFGATSAAAYGGALAISSGASLLGSGLQPGGEVLPWSVRLVTLAIALPLLTMAAVGLGCASIWLRHRAPLRDRDALGPLGRPVVAVMLAGVLVVAASSLEQYVPGGWWLAIVLVLAGVALIGLRRAIHVGLLEEAAEIPVGPGFECANCGAQTPAHTFCIACGISRQAMPKPRRAT